ncbi:SDR family oxidoreductase [Serratia plymuthica]|uniref:SDR family NAD(P)-dependent oxidoreductase n=1 Tax=Serratia plymuthica TaxID=82996 RepID=UPI001BB0318E|nr:SDR family oxidoreductase [Serratia plymuthica]QUY50267.1 SDR family oxidoreductase [Serratia plymuthica]
MQNTYLPPGLAPFSLLGKRALITGATRGIGQALAIGLAQAGAQVIVAGRQRAALQEVVQQLNNWGEHPEMLLLDVQDSASIETAFAALAGKPLDILINNAGIERLCPSLEVDETLWDSIVGTNLKGAFFCAQAAARLMVKQGGGSIINLCSLTSEVGVPGATAYGASKSGLAGMTRALASEWAAHGIRVNGIGPGYFQTAMTEVFYRDKGWCESMQDKIPLGRFGKLSDLTGAAIFLAGPAAAYITGQILYVDGGYLASI